ncbi:MAG TPA: NlpC/P60 family protein [Bacteroidota bacterium]|nr:NlpC/P60 family protein [Bacteroidota bacterium]
MKHIVLRGSLGRSRGFFALMANRAVRLTVSLSLMAWGLLSLPGCGASSPRFGNAERSSAASERKPPGARFSAKEIEEEKAEDDKKVAPEVKESIVAGKRDFRKEKNPAIKPLDQSKMMREISRYMGIPYEYGGDTPQGLDCSGYTMLVFKNSVGVQLPRTSADQSKIGKPVSFEDLKFGDLVFFNTTGESASHVGIYLGDDLFAHASVTLGVTISSLQSSYFKKRYEGARRVIAQ